MPKFCLAWSIMNEIQIYNSDNQIEIKVQFENDTVWLTQNQIAEIFEIQRPAISKHLNNIFKSGELDESVVSSILEHTTEHGAIKGKKQTRKVKYYNLDAIISVGYRVNSIRATEFRIWATQRLKAAAPLLYLCSFQRERCYALCRLHFGYKQTFATASFRKCKEYSLSSTLKTHLLRVLSV